MSTKAHLETLLTAARKTIEDITEKWHQSDHRLAVRVAEVQNLCDQRDALQRDIEDLKAQRTSTHSQLGVLKDERDWLRDVVQLAISSARDGDS